MGENTDGDTGQAEAIAIVGAACRFPGGIDDLDQLWEALSTGRDLVGQVPPDRFEADRFVDESMPRKGKSYTAAGGFLGDVAGFDAGYFGISPREAAQMDPQHRLLLEMAAEALDDAAIDPATWAGTDAAVYVGISDTSYGALQMLATDTVNPYTMPGAASSIAANRLSHFLDLRGPSMAVDTACSSALVALDRACKTLLEGTSPTALCGGVNALLSPYHYIGFSQASMLSPTGRCRSFSAGADGYVRAEGAGLVVLKRLADALADGDRVHGVILGSAANSDGRTMGLALPSADAQADLLRRAYRRAGVHPDELVYLEAHGTGTPVGDPIEAHAIGRALAVDRGTGALPIGSVKSNLGHLEPASGMAGLFKALLVLRHGIIPASLHTDPPSLDIDFAGLNLATVPEPRPVAGVERPVVGVNSFGFGGTNAHVLLTAPPSPAAGSPGEPVGEAVPVVVTARTPGAAAEAAARLADRLDGASQQEFYDIAHTTCRRRGRHPYRAAVLAAGAAEAAGRLRSVAAAKAVGNGGVVLVFPGNGSQWAGMGSDLLAGDAVFRAAVEAVDAELASYLEWSVAREMALPPGEWRLSATEVAQPMLFAVQVGLVHMLRARGVEPAAVVGHSVGEIPAAYAAGILTLADATRVLAERSRAQAPTAGAGRMVAVGLERREVEEILPGFPGVEVAAVNAGDHVTVSGPAGQLKLLVTELALRQVVFRELELDYAFHSAAMDGVRDTLERTLAKLKPAAARVPFVSTLTGGPLEGTALDAEYWARTVREPVLFAPAVETLLDMGFELFAEVGPQPVVRPYLRRVIAARQDGKTRQSGNGAVTLPTLRHGDDGVSGTQAVETALTTLIAAGAELDWRIPFPRPGKVVDLPAYPWQRERHWTGGPDSWVRSIGDGRIDHPLLGERLPVLEPTWYGRIEPVLVPWLADHRVGGSVVMPATGHVEMLLAAGRRAFDAAAEVRHMEIMRPLVVPWGDEGGVHVQVSLSAEDGVATIAGAETGGGEMAEYARGQVRRLLRPRPPALDLEALRARLGCGTGAEEHYALADRFGLRYGPAFRVLTGFRSGETEVLAAYRHDPAADRRADRYEVHPALLDGALQAGVPLLAGLLADGRGYLPSAIEAVRVWERPGQAGFVHVRHRSRTQTEMCWDIVVTDEHGAVAVEIEGCRLRRYEIRQGVPLSRHQVVLRAAPRPDEPAERSPLPSPAQVVDAAAEEISELRADWHRQDYGPGAARVLEVVAHSFAEAIRGLLAAPAEPFGVQDLITAGMRPDHGRLIELTAPLMQRHGLMTAEEPGRWLLATGQGRDDARRLLRDSIICHPANSAESLLTARVAQHLPEILRGTCDPLELLMPDGALESLEQLYDLAPAVRFHNRIAQALMRRIVARWPGDRPLRILEVGAGTGGITAALLPLLPADRTRYVYTDVSPLFFNRAQKRFADHDFVEYRTLDLNADPAGQGFTPGTFDIVIAGHALHVAGDLAAALRRVAGLLAPGGRLLAVEAHDPELLVMFFGALDSFWNIADPELRPRSLLLPRDRWAPLLRRCGFPDVAQTGDDRRPCRDHYSVILASTCADQDAQHPAAHADGATGWLVVTESARDDVLAEAVANRLRSAARGAAVVNAGSGLASEALAGPLPDADRAGIVLLLGEDGAEDADGLVRQATRRAALMRTIAGVHRPGQEPTAFWLVTRPSGVQPAPERALEPADAAAWGVARSLGNEEPGLRVRRVSLDRTGEAETDARRLVAELTAPDDEDEIVLTRGGRFVPRATPLPPVRTAPAEAASGRCPAAYRLRVREPGLSYRLAWVETGPLEPEADEVVIDVAAAALNYRDIMLAVGLLPAEAAQDRRMEQGLGVEYAGVVAAVGSAVTTVAPGDRVVALGLSAMGTQVRTVEHAVSPIPPTMSFTEAVTLPVAFLTVHYALEQLARVRPGETVLVHGAAGGVGMATLQYAGHRGAQVIATAGTSAKRDLLRAMGVEHVFDSRSLDFGEQIMELTRGRGVDVVLNSLSGEAIARGLETLAPGGRFIELGKRDIYENKPLLLGAFKNNITFAALDLTRLMNDPRCLAPHYDEIATRIAAGAYRPLPHRVFPAARVQEAFHLLQHSRHIGKVVIAFDPLDEAPRVERLSRRPRLDPGATYLVVGGLGGFGAATARWLADLGARHLTLIGRRGAGTPGADRLLADLAERGVHATVQALDATDLPAMRAVLDGIDAGGHPLRGVVHSAMHVDDDLLVNLSDERMAASLAPKVAVASVLDALTRDRELEFFLMYSSSAGFIGQPGQTNYVAGNLYLEALVRQRLQAGLPGLAIAWGALGETGYVARNELAGNMARLGVETVTTDEALTAAGRLLTGEQDVAGVGRYNWGRLRELVGSLATPRYSMLMPPMSPAGGQTREELVRELAALPRSEAQRRIAGYLAMFLAEVFQMPADQLDHDRRLDEYGLDSLMGAELLVMLREHLGLDIPPMELVRSAGTITEISRIILTRLGLVASEAEAEPPTQADADGTVQNDGAVVEPASS
ncbi:type I polyketide synthase [Actinomadura rubrisoli]|uniref:Acyltransferase domain-containing protein n=1 Tax=Actinomadura rubrisoli TaxID=2530368 RepID=A0A4R5BQE0_9ACTN|nr:type I polyketide synthase [Actinomadura rubrisoli]TDD89141.1 acyltransferase domain-containing protein [Actinomadura rubrisoli]